MKPEEKNISNRVERKKEETRQKIITIALELFQQQGCDATTMEQIADRVDIAKGTLYHYFPVKEAIISAYIQNASLARNAERIVRLQQLPDTRSRLILSLQELIEGIREQQDIFEKYFVYKVQNMISLHRAENIESGLHSLEGEIIKLGQQSGEIRTDLPFEILEALFEFVFIEVAQQFYKNPETFNDSGTIEQCVDLFISGARRVR